MSDNIFENVIEDPLDSFGPEVEDDESLSGLEPETVPNEIIDESKPTEVKPIVRIRKDVPSDFIDPLARREFTFMINGCAYRVYDVRSRGRRGVKFMGVAEYGS